VHNVDLDDDRALVDHAFDRLQEASIAQRAHNCRDLRVRKRKMKKLFN
jgi:hypothetical protein